MPLPARMTSFLINFMLHSVHILSNRQGNATWDRNIKETKALNILIKIWISFLVNSLWAAYHFAIYLPGCHCEHDHRQGCQENANLHVDFSTAFFFFKGYSARFLCSCFVRCFRSVSWLRMKLLLFSDDERKISETWKSLTCYQLGNSSHLVNHRSSKI